MEFESVRELLVQHGGSALGRERLRALVPAEEVSTVRARLDRTQEAVRLLHRPGRQPYHDLPDPRETLAACRAQGAALAPAQLLDAASFIEGAREIGCRVAEAEGAPGLSRRASEIADATEASAAIRRALLPSGEVADDASPELAELRRRLARLRVQLHSVMESYLHGRDADRLLQDKLVTTRNDRFVLLLKAEQRGQIPGIIHGSSGSGATLFVEPMPAVELNNDIVSVGEDEQREVARILRGLTERLRRHADALDAAAEILGELDAAQACALLARDMDATAPEIVEQAGLELRSARHPLLIPELCARLGQPRRSSRPPVPVTLRVGFGESILVISGPNTGGKTVALKTVGLLGLMAQCGLHVPAAAGSRLPVFRSVYADIGDEQSITESLSTFSAHLAQIVEMSRDLRLPSLVLLDEVGAGTDPTEGGALGVAIVDHFRTRGALVIATTHHGLLKAYAQSTPGVSCASFGYDPSSYEPTFELSLGAPGRSLALEMAERLGLPASVVADARARLDAKQVEAEALLQQAERERAALEADQAGLARERTALEHERSALRRAERELDERRHRQAESFAAELKRKTERAERRAEEAIEAALKRLETARRATPALAARAQGGAVRAMREAQREALDDPALGLEVEAEELPGDVQTGDRARIGALGLVGEVLAVHGDEAELAVSGKRMRVPLVRVRKVAARPAAAVRTGSVAQPTRAAVPGEINVVGLRVDEALPRVDKLLDDAALGDRDEVRVIHGFGQGRLRRAVAELLEGHPHVATFRVGGPNEGGGGVTVVTLKQ